MHLFCVISLLMGILFNEEVFLCRLSKNLSYPHEGWLLVKHDHGFFLFVFAIFFTIFKSWLWASILIKFCGVWWLIPAGIYVIASFLAVSLAKGLYYSAWLSFLGLTIANNVLCFQGSFTMAIVYFLLTRNFTGSVRIWRVSLGLLTLVFVPWPQGLYWSILLVLCYLYSKKLSPFSLNLIK